MSWVFIALGLFVGCRLIDYALSLVFGYTAADRDPWD